MYNYIVGKYVDLYVDKIVLECNGVGYEMFISSRDYVKANRFTRGMKELFNVHLIHKENEMVLYGFYEKEDKAFFRKLIKINGLGPKLAMCILSVYSSTDMDILIATNDVKGIMAIKGVGKKMAQKMLEGLK